MPSGPSPDRASQSMRISGGQFSNVQLGQAGRDLTQIQDSSTNQAALPTVDEVKTLLEQLKDLINNANLPANEQSKALSYLISVAGEVETDQPDKEFALKGFQRVTQVLKEAAEAAESEVGEGFWQKFQPIAAKLAPWFGVATKALLLL